MKMLERDFWNYIFKLSIWMFAILGVLSLVAVWIDLPKPIIFKDYPFETNSRLTQYPEYAYWIGFLSYIAFPMILLYFSFMCWHVIREEEIYRHPRLSLVFFLALLLISMIFLKNGFSGISGRFSVFYTDYFIGIYVMTFGIWFTLIFSFLMPLLVILSKIKNAWGKGA